MRQDIFRPFGLCVGSGLLIAGLALTGCDGGEKPITASAKKYEAAGESDPAGESSATAPGEGAPRAPLSGEPGAAPPRAGGSAAPSAASATSPGSGTTAGGRAPAPTETETPQAEPGAPEKPPAVAGSSFVSPDSPAALINILEQVNPNLDMIRSEPDWQGKISQNPQLLSNIEMMVRKGLESADKLLGQKTDAQTRMLAFQSKLNALDFLGELGNEKAQQELTTFCKAMGNDKEPDVAHMAQVLFIAFRINRALESKEPAAADLETIVADADKALAYELAGPQTYFVLQGVALQLLSGAQVEAGDRLVAKLAARFKDHPELSTPAKALPQMAVAVKLGFNEKRRDFMQGKPDAQQAYLGVVKQLLELQEPGMPVLESSLVASRDLESRQFYAESQEIFNGIEKAYANTTMKDMADFIQISLADAKQRLSLMGTPIKIEGTLVDGQSLKWDDYQNKVVLVNFWSARDTASVQELSNINQQYMAYHEKGLEVIGVNVDANAELLKEFFRHQQLPWKTVMDKPDAETSLARQCGVRSQTMPFTLLIDRSGKVAALYTMGSRLEPALAKLFDQPPAESTSQGHLPAALLTYPVALLDDESADDAADGPKDKTPAAAADQGEEKPAGAVPEEEINPYLARPGLSPSKLVDFIFNMEDKPKSIRARKAFVEAMLDATDRILAADDAKERDKLFALDTKLTVLHQRACQGDEEFDERLTAFVETLKADERPRVAKQVEFFRLEKRVMEVDELELKDVPALLDELKTYFTDQKLKERHVRIASGTVHAINRLEDGDQREEHFKAFGKLFAASTDRTLARYGKKLMGSGPGASSLVGKELELAGTTALGTPFNWETYRGKVVIVDFWATWCGPCLRELPHVREFYEKHKDKGLDVVGISLDKDAEALARFLEEKKLPWTNLAGEETQELAQKYGVRGIPTMMLVDQEGKVVAVSHRIEQLQQKAEELLAK